MARITVEDCLEKVDNQYDLVLLAKERTVQLNAGSPILVDEDNDKRTIISLAAIQSNCWACFSKKIMAIFVWFPINSFHHFQYL